MCNCGNNISRAARLEIYYVEIKRDTRVEWKWLGKNHSTPFPWHSSVEFNFVHITHRETYIAVQLGYNTTREKLLLLESLVSDKTESFLGVRITKYFQVCQGIPNPSQGIPNRCQGHPIKSALGGTCSLALLLLQFKLTSFGVGSYKMSHFKD